MSSRFDWIVRERWLIAFAAMLWLPGLSGCGQDVRQQNLNPPEMARAQPRHAHIQVRIAGMSSPAPANSHLAGFYANAATLQLRIEAPDVLAYHTPLPVTTLDNVVKVPAGMARMFHLEVENQWGLAIYQSGPLTVDLMAGENRELLFRLEPIKTVLPLVSAAAFAGRKTVLAVEAEDSPVQDLRLTIPDQMRSQPLLISIDEIYSADEIPSPNRQASVIIDIQPHGVQLTRPATLTFPYYQALAARWQLPENHLQIRRFAAPKQQWQPLVRQRVNTDDNVVTAELSQFGLFALTVDDKPAPMAIDAEPPAPSAPREPAMPVDQPPQKVVKTAQIQTAETAEPLNTTKKINQAEPVAWRNDRVDLTLLPYRRGPIGIMLRYQNMQMHYRFVWELDRQQAHFVKYYQGHRTRLASAPLPYRFSQAYAFHIVTQSDAFHISVDGKLILTVRDGDIPVGDVALNCADEVQQCFDAVRIE